MYFYRSRGGLCGVFLLLLTVCSVSGCEGDGPAGSLPPINDSEMFEKVFANWQLEERVTQGAAETLRSAEVQLEAYETNQIRNYRGFATGKRYLFMPNPGRPRLGSQRTLQLSDVNAAYIDVSLSEGGHAKLIVDDKWHFVISAEEPQAPGHHEWLQYRGPWDSINVYRGSSLTHVCLHVRCRTIDSPRPRLDLQLHGTGAIISNVQTYDEERWRLVELQDTLPIEGAAGAVPSVLSWERLSRDLFISSLMSAEALGLCTAPPPGELSGHICERVSGGVSALAQTLLSTLARWPSWRAYDASIEPSELADTESWATWDRGNWANGYLPAAYATLLTIAKANDTPASQLSDYEAEWRRKGLRFVMSPSFPDVQHWIRRSTNHAALIYGNLFGATLLVENCHRSSVATELLERFSEITSASFTDGFYSESISYGEFFVSDSWFGAFVQGACEGNSLRTQLESYYSGALGDFALRSLELTLPSHRRWMHYGDSSDAGWRSDTAAMMAVFQPAWQQVKTIKGNYPNVVARLTRGESTIAPSAAADAPLDCRMFPAAGVALAAGTVSGIPIKLGVVSMPVHLTHNKDWDLGAITVSVGGSAVIGEHRGGSHAFTRAGYTHSTAWLEPSRHPGCFEQPGSCGGRRISGRLVPLLETSNRCTFSSRGNMHPAQHRVVDVTEIDTGITVTVIDVASLVQGSSLALNFNIEPGWLEQLRTVDISAEPSDHLVRSIQPLQLPRQDVQQQSPKHDLSFSLYHDVLEIEGRMISLNQFHISRQECDESAGTILQLDSKQLSLSDACTSTALGPLGQRDLLTGP